MSQIKVYSMQNDSKAAVPLLVSFKNYVESKRDRFDIYESQGKELSGVTNYYVLTKTRSNPPQCTL